MMALLVNPRKVIFTEQGPRKFMYFAAMCYFYLLVRFKKVFYVKDAINEKFSFFSVVPIIVEVEIVILLFQITF